MKRVLASIFAILAAGALAFLFQNCSKNGFKAGEVIIGADGSIQSSIEGGTFFESCLHSQANNPILCNEWNQDIPANSCPDSDPTDNVTIIQAHQACPRGNALLGRCYVNVSGKVTSAYVYDRAFLYPDPALGAQANSLLVSTGRTECANQGGTWEDL